MTALDRLSRLMPDLASTLARFAIPALVSLVICIYANLDVGGFVDDGWSASHPVYAAGAAAFFAAGAADYFATGRGWTRFQAIALSMAAAVVAAALLSTVEIAHPDPLFFFAGLALLLMIAGFLRSGASQRALWSFDLRLGLAALLATLVGLIFAAGLSAIVESLSFLFEFDLPSALHEHIWATALSLVGPIYGLSLAPRRVSDEIDFTGCDATLIERGVSVLVNYVLVPIIIVYAAILHAYAVKIAIDGGLPKGQIGLMVTIYALGGTAAWIVAWPWRERGPRLLRLFMRIWFWLTIVPAILLMLAVWRRVADYGVTPERYGLALVALWLVVVAAYLALRRNRADLRMILGSLAVLLIVGSVGPWGANGLSIASQSARLSAILNGAGLLSSDGRLVDPLPKINEEARGETLSLLQILRDVGGLGPLKPWFAGRKDDPFATDASDWDLFAKITVALDVTDSPQKSDFVTFVANLPFDRSFAASGRIIGPMRVIEHFGFAVPQEDMTAVADGSTLNVNVGERNWLYPVRSIMDRAKEVQANPKKVQPFIVDAAPDLSLIFVSVSGEAGDPPKLRTAEVWLILRQ